MRLVNIPTEVKNKNHGKVLVMFISSIRVNTTPTYMHVNYLYFI